MNSAQRELHLAKAIAKASTDHTIASCQWTDLSSTIQDRLIVIARLTIKLEEDSRG